MNRTGTDPQERDWSLAGADRRPLSYIAAGLLAVPTGAILWFELTYLWFGLTGEDPTPAVELAGYIAAFGFVVGASLYRTRRPAETVQQSCRVGVAVAALLPVVAFAVLLIWQSAPARRDLGMGGLMLYSVPFVALGLAMVLVLLFSIGSRLAARRMDTQGDSADRVRGIRGNRTADGRADEEADAGDQRP